MQILKLSKDSWFAQHRGTKTTVLEMFGGSPKATIDYVQGTSERFKCRLYCEAKTIEDVRGILSSFEENTYITTKPSKSL